MVINWKTGIKGKRLKQEKPVAIWENICLYMRRRELGRRWRKMQESFISDEEREKCRKVAEAFREALADEDLVVLDAGRFGFVKLQYYKPPWGFDNVFTFLDAGTLFDDLWEEWMDSQLLDYAKGTPMAEMEYEQIFKCMPKDIQDSYVLKKQEFMEAAGCGFLSGFGKA